MEREEHVMQQAATTRLLLPFAVVFCGCITPFNTRLPTVESAPAPFEKQSYQRHDPFADGDLGPDPGIRPRDYIAPRSTPRKAAELRIFRGHQIPLNPPDESRAPSGPDYSRVVDQ